MRRWAVAVALTSMAARADALALPDVRRLALPDAKAVLFDIDGTLFDSDPVHLEAFRRVLAAEGFNGGAAIDAAFFRRAISAALAARRGVLWKVRGAASSPTAGTATRAAAARGGAGSGPDPCSRARSRRRPRPAS